MKLSRVKLSLLVLFASQLVIIGILALCGFDVFGLRRHSTACAWTMAVCCACGLLLASLLVRGSDRVDRLHAQRY